MRSPGLIMVHWQDLQRARYSGSRNCVQRAEDLHEYRFALLGSAMLFHVSLPASVAGAMPWLILDRCGDADASASSSWLGLSPCIAVHRLRGERVLLVQLLRASRWKARRHAGPDRADRKRSVVSGALSHSCATRCTSAVLGRSSSPRRCFCGSLSAGCLTACANW